MYYELLSYLSIAVAVCFGNNILLLLTDAPDGDNKMMHQLLVVMVKIVLEIFVAELMQKEVMKQQPFVQQQVMMINLDQL